MTNSTLRSAHVTLLANRKAWWRDLFTWGFFTLAAAAYVISSIEYEEWGSSLVLYAAVTAGSLLTIFLTRNRLPESSLPSLNAREGWLALAWYAVFVGVSLATAGGNVFGNEFMKYLWFIVLPIVMLYFLRGRQGFRELLRSIGLRREGLGRSLLLGLLVYIVVFGGFIFFMPDTQMDKLRELAQTPAKLLLVIPLGFGFALITAAFTEEVFFRGVLQTRLASLMRSEVRGLLAASLLFGLYHLPYAYFSESWPAHGNILWALSSVIAEQAVTGIILGVLWMRTRNLAAPILLHALINTLPILTMFNAGGG